MGSGRSDRGSMPLAMLLILVGVSLSALLVPIVGGQVTATRTDGQRARALDAAQAGVEIAMAHLRSAADPTGKTGLLERLPGCDFAGHVGPGGSAPPLRYRVRVVYRNADDAPIGCPPVDTPSTAVLTVTGSGLATGPLVAGARGTRTLTATYHFSLYNANILGGAIRISKNGAPFVCLDAGMGAAPASGQLVKVLPCAPGASKQRFAYTKDQNIRLVGSETAAVPGGMCLDAGGTPTAGAFVIFRPCGNRIPQQRWLLDAVTDFYSTANGITRGSPCFDVVGSDLKLGACGSGQGRVLNVDISVGAGMADASTGQLVNYKQFNRCLDVTNGDPGWSHMIAWHCHQAPDGNFAWNQRWVIPTPAPPAVSIQGRIRIVRTSDNSNYCLRSPGSVTAGAYVDTEPCTATGALGAGMLWTVYTDTGDYASSYRIVDEYGFCLVITDLEAANPDRYNGVSKTKVETCSASLLQKWNADPNMNRPNPLTDIDEN